MEDDISSVGIDTQMAENQFIDFATDEFINKNIRVRPTSGITNSGEREDQKSEYLKQNMMTSIHEGTMDEEDKFNQFINLEMEGQRKQIKLEREKLEKQK